MKIVLQILGNYNYRLHIYLLNKHLIQVWIELYMKISQIALHTVFSNRASQYEASKTRTTFLAYI